MGKVNAPLLAFNRGIVSALALARIDVDRIRLSAEKMTNWLPKTQGAMRLRPGTKYLGSSYSDTGATWIEFIASTDETALLELTPTRLRVWDGADDTLVARATRTTAIADFNTDTGVWTSGSTGGATIGFGDTGLVLNSDYVGSNAKATRKLALGDTGDKNVEIGLAINVGRGPVRFRAGNDTGDDSYISETELRTGYHSLALTPTDTGGIHFQFESDAEVKRIVSSIGFDDTGTMVVTTPWAASDLDNIRYDQSADVVFVAAYNKKQMRIERRGSGRSWSVVDYVPVDGPFFTSRTSRAKIRPHKSGTGTDGTRGNIQLVSDRNFFQSGHVGSLFRILHDGQGGYYRFTTGDSYSDVWKVTGINDTGSPGERTTTVVLTDTGTWTGNLRLQRSFEGPDSGFRTKETYTTTGTKTDLDGDDNVTVYYRLAALTGDITKGAITAKVTYNNGAKDGVCRVTGYNSPTSVDAEVISRFSDSGYSEDWAEGRWSDAQTFPSSVALHEGRLWWFGGARIYGSVSDDYENWNAATVGDSAPINRTLATGPIDRIHWGVSLVRMHIGTAGEEIALRSTSLDEPLTPTNMAAKRISTQGTANVRAVPVDDRAVFLQRGQDRLYMLVFDPSANDYVTQELTLLVPELLSGVSSIAVQRKPDTRIHCVMDDGTVAILTYQGQEEVTAWSIWKSSAASSVVEKAMVLPGTNEDQVYYHVNRTINGATKRYLERWANEHESDGDTGSNFLMDSALTVSLSDTGVASGLDHLEGEQVVVWAAKDLSYDDTGGNQTLYTVTSGKIQLGVADTGFGVINAQIGLPYIARTTGKEMDAEHRSTKLAYAAQAGTALTMKKRVDHIGVVLGRTHNNGLFYGRTLAVSDLRRLPRIIEGRTLNDTGQDRDEIFDTGQEIEPVEFPGNFDTDSRLCLTAKCPRPVTLMAAVLGIGTNDKI